MRRKNIYSVIIFTILLFFIIYISGIWHFRFPFTEEIRNAITSSTDVDKNYNKGTELELKKNYGIFEKEVEDYIYYSPLSSMDASEILVVKFSNSKLANKYKSSVENRIVKRVEMYRSYRPEEAEILDNSIIEIKGNYLIFVASKDIDKIKSSLDLAFK